MNKKELLENVETLYNENDKLKKEVEDLKSKNLGLRMVNALWEAEFKLKNAGKEATKTAEEMKKEPKFKVGDRVLAKKYSSDLKAFPGTIKGFYNNESDWYKVEFDDDFGGHDCHGACKPGHGWNIPEKNIEPMFKIGDRVLANTPHTDGWKLGTIVDFSINENVGVRFDDEIPAGHDCWGKCEEKHGWYCSLGDVKPYDEKAKKAYLKKTVINSIKICEDDNRGCAGCAYNGTEDCDHRMKQDILKLLEDETNG